jgi:PTH1 family peptidyl-tRNA hydrolase
MAQNSNIFDPSRIKMFAGLGNPGTPYRNTYHNIGFAAAELLSGTAPGAEWKKAKDFLYVRSGSLVFLKPKNFMNESGASISNALRYFKIKPENLLIIHDESDIETGDYRLSFGSGAAGHKGVASVIERLKTKDFWRARIGVRSRKGKAGDFVLKKISAGDGKKLKAALEGLRMVLLND